MLACFILYKPHGTALKQGAIIIAGEGATAFFN